MDCRESNTLGVTCAISLIAKGPTACLTEVRRLLSPSSTRPGSWPGKSSCLRHAKGPAVRISCRWGAASDSWGDRRGNSAKIRLYSGYLSCSKPVQKTLSPPFRSDFPFEVGIWRKAAVLTLELVHSVARDCCA